MTVERKCCGRRIVRLHEHVPRGPHVVRDEYIVLLETVNGRPSRISVSETLEEARPAPGVAYTEADYDFSLERVPRSSRWGYTTSFGSGSSMESRPGEPATGLGLWDECHLVDRVPTGYYRAMLMLLRNAMRHVSSAGRIVPRDYC